MSGGYFDYKQYHIQDLIEQMEEVLVRLEKEPIDSYECDSLKKRIDNRGELPRPKERGFLTKAL